MVDGTAGSEDYVHRDHEADSNVVEEARQPAELSLPHTAQMAHHCFGLQRKWMEGSVLEPH